MDKWDYFERDATSTGLLREFDTWLVYSQYLQPFQPKVGLPKGGGVKKSTAFTVQSHHSLDESELTIYTQEDHPTGPCEHIQRWNAHMYAR